jgi:ribosomal protein S18 acetylase RimI-like enzyme
MPLINALQENFFAIGRYWGSLNSSLANINSIYAMKTDIPSADLNWAWNEKPLTTKRSVKISQIKYYYKQSALPFWWWVYPKGQSSTIREILQAQGINFLMAIPCMAADLSSLNAKQDVASTVAVSSVKNKTDLHLWGKISFDGFEMDSSTQKQYRNFIASFDLSSKSPQKLFIARFDGVPVASALLFFYQDTAGIYFVSTLPGYRRKGIGLALTLATMHAAKQSGFKYCILQSSESGLHVYEQAGFKEYCRADVYCLEEL